MAKSQKLFSILIFKLHTFLKNWPFLTSSLQRCRPTLKGQLISNYFLVSFPKTNPKIGWISALEFKKWLNQTIKGPFSCLYLFDLNLGTQLKSWDYRLPALLKTPYEIKSSLKNCGKYWRENPKNSFNPDTTVFTKNMLDYHFQNIHRSIWNSNLKMYCLISIAFLMLLHDIIQRIWIKIREIPTR